MSNPRHFVLYIPAEKFPTHQSFMTEVYSMEDNYFYTIFLMRANEKITEGSPVKWNKSKVYFFQHENKYKILQSIYTYFFLDIRYLYLIPYIVFKEKISIIQVRDMTFPLFVALTLKLFLRKKVVYQKSFPHEYRKKDPSVTAEYRLPWLAGFTATCENSILHFMMKYCDAILPISERMGKDLQGEYGLPAKKIHPFGMGFNFKNLEYWEAKPVQVEKNNFRLIYIGMHARREIDVLIHGIKRAIKHLQLQNLSFEFIGGSPTEVAEFENLASKLNVLEYCHFSGWIERSEVYKKILNSHVGVAWVGRGVRFSVASPTKTIEYLALGIPIIATNSVFLHKELIQDTGAGVCCQVDADDFAKQLSSLIENYGEYKNNALNAGSYMKEKYSYTVIRHRVCNLYDTL